MAISISTPDVLFKWLQNSGLQKKYGLKKIGVFGSFARGEPHKDIDLLLEDEHIDWKSLEAFRHEFQIQTGEKLDIMVRQFAEPLIFKTALRDIRYAAFA